MIFRFHAAALRPPNAVFRQAALGAASQPPNDFTPSSDRRANRPYRPGGLLAIRSDSRFCGFGLVSRSKPLGGYA